MRFYGDYVPLMEDLYDPYFTDLQALKTEGVMRSFTLIAGYSFFSGLRHRQCSVVEKI